MDYIQFWPVAYTECTSFLHILCFSVTYSSRGSSNRFKKLKITTSSKPLCRKRDRAPQKFLFQPPPCIQSNSAQELAVAWRQEIGTRETTRLYLRIRCRQIGCLFFYLKEHIYDSESQMTCWTKKTWRAQVQLMVHLLCHATIRIWQYVMV